MSPIETSYVDPFGMDVDLETGAMPAAAAHLVRRASDMRGYYIDAAALERLITDSSDPVHYEVFEARVPLERGHLMYCISKLQPGLVGQECFMTKGHYHSVPNTAELYLCLRGEGYMVMKTAEGQFVAERMNRGRLVYVPPFWAHRSVNTSPSSPLISLCVYPAEAGHNYGDISKEGFPKRIFRRNGQVFIE